jgi:Holliday junction resolvase
MNEQGLQAKIIKYLIAKGFDVIKIIRCNRNGVSDIIACAPDGKFWAIEVKWGSNKPSALQEHYVSEILKRNGVAFITWDLETVVAWVSMMLPTALHQTQDTV